MIMIVIMTRVMNIIVIIILLIPILLISVVRIMVTISILPPGPLLDLFQGPLELTAGCRSEQVLSGHALQSLDLAGFRV